MMTARHRVTLGAPLHFWERTLAERFAKRGVTREGGPPSSRRDIEPFASERLPFSIEPYTYQLALSRRSAHKVFRHAATDNPDVPDSGDRRSGVILYHGERIIGHVTCRGITSGRVDWVAFVDREHQGKGLAVEMYAMWNYASGRWRDTTIAIDTVPGALLGIKAHRRVIAMALENGCDVPQSAIDSVVPGSRDEREIIARLGITDEEAKRLAA